MSIKALFMHWPIALKEPGRVLDDLAMWTDINTIIASNTYWQWGRKGAPLVLPSIDAFEGLNIPSVSDEQYDSMMGFLRLAKDKGFKVACDVCPLHPSSPELGKLRMVDITEREAEMEVFVGHGCPNNPKVLQWAETMMRETVASWPSVDIVHLNHMEYPIWPRQGLKGMFVCFCDHCHEKAETQGIDFEKMKQELKTFYHLLTSPSDEQRQHIDFTASDLLSLFIERPQLAIWINFRMNALTEFTIKVTEACREAAREHQPHLKIGLEFYLPSMARLFGTDYEELSSLFDWLAPKFPDYLTGTIIPLIADEITHAKKRGEAAELRRVLRELFDLGPGPEIYQPCDPKDEDMYYSNTFDLSTVSHQMKHLQALQGEIPMYPCVWLYKHDLNSLKEKIKTYKDNGFDGYCLWLWEPDLTTDAIKGAKGVY